MLLQPDRLNARQKANLRQAIAQYNARSTISSEKPPVLYLELTQNCAGACVFCKKKKYNDPAYNMSDALFERILVEYIQEAVVVDLRGFGESLILPDFAQYAARVARCGPKLSITTSLGCGNRAALKSLIDYDVYVSVSFDYADKTLYEQMRTGLSYDTVTRNIEWVASAMRANGTLARNMRLGIAPLGGMNLNQVDKILRLADRWGIQQVLISQLVSNPGNQNLLEHNKAKTIATLANAACLAKQLGITLQLARCPFPELYIREKAFDLCCHPWLYSLIDFRGNLFFCDHLLGARWKECAVGHVDQGAGTAWNGPKAQLQRQQHIDQDKSRLPEKCRLCYSHGRYADHEHEIDKQFEKWLVTESDIEPMLLRHRPAQASE